MINPVTCPDHGVQEVTHLGPETVTLACGARVYEGAVTGHPARRHDSACFAAAMMHVIGVLAREEDEVGFRVAVQDNVPLTLADSWLADGTIKCRCR